MFDKDKIKTIVLIGAGGVGFYLALGLGPTPRNRTVVVFDDDNFEGGHGHERLPKVGNRSQLKVEFLRNFSILAFGDSPMKIYPQRLTVEFINQELFRPDLQWNSCLVVDGSDMEINQRREIWQALQSQGAQMLRVSYDGAVGVVIATGLPLGARPGGGYAEIPSRALSFWAGGVGAQAVFDILDGKKVEDVLYEKPGKVVEGVGG